MRQADVLHTNFTSGEVSPKLAARLDLARQANSCLTMQNFLIDELGGAFKAPGTEFIAEVADSSRKARLIPFVYSDEQAYVLEFGNETIRFFMDEGQVLSGLSPYEISSPYGEDDLPGLSWCQSADVMFLFHQSYPTYKLSRYDHDDWTIVAVEWQDGPYLELNDDPDRYLTPSATYGTITLTATTGKSVFSANHVGALFRLRHSGESGRFDFHVAGAVSTAYIMYGKFTVDLSPYQISETSEGGSVFTQPYHHPWQGHVVLQKSYDAEHWLDVASFFYATKQEFIENQMGVYYRLYCKEYYTGNAYLTISQDEKWGVVQIASVTSAILATATVISALGGTDPTAEWREGAWSASNGYPRAGVFGPDNRLWLAGTAHQPLTMWASWVGDYENMAPGLDQADGPLNLTINSRDASAIRWLQNYRGIAVGTSSAEGLVTSGDPSTTAITAKSPPQFTQHSTHGSAFDGVYPIRVGQSILVLHRHRRRVLEMTYDLASDGMKAPNLNQLAEHITESGIKEMAFADYPIPQLWCVRNDGEIAVLTYIRNEEVVGWSRIVTDGTVESICVIPSSMAGAEGTDQVWLLVARTIGGETRRYVELIKDNREIDNMEDYWYLHCALAYNGTAISTVSGLSHLAGETVTCLADGIVLRNKTVSATGTVALGRSAERVLVGLPYTSILQPCPIQPQGTEGVKKRIAKLWLRLFKSLGGTIGPDEDTQDVIAMRVPGQDMDAQVPVYTGDWQMPFAGGAAEKVDIMIRHGDPLPFNVLGIISKLVVYDS